MNDKLVLICGRREEFVLINSVSSLFRCWLYPNEKFCEREAVTFIVRDESKLRRN